MIGIVAIPAASAQEVEAHAVFVEAGGSGFVYSLNYERRLNSSVDPQAVALRVRAGLAINPWITYQTIWVPLGVEAGIPFRNPFELDVAAGITPFFGVGEKLEVAPWVTFGVRYSTSRWFGRLNGLLFFPESFDDGHAAGREAFPWLGLSLGRYL